MVLHPATQQYSKEKSILSAGNLQLDLNGRALLLNDQTIMLSEIDFRLIGYLMEHADQVVDRQTLLNCGWVHNPNAKPGFVAAPIQRLRSKIEKTLRNHDISLLCQNGVHRAYYIYSHGIKANN